ncbi:divalent cation tolerance protein CutA, partial [Candidatus Micrarchaeota archaeon]|nr:divalent cation tolerance protein CutA [Candidatus Micrarchaeota archaeon]
LCKTLAGRRTAVEKRVRELHSYKVPCIVFYSASKAFNKYFEWVEKSVKKVK